MIKYIIIVVTVVLLLYYISHLYKKDQKITKINDFISKSQCDQLISLASNRFVDSTIVGSNTNTNIDKTKRSSSCVYFKRGENDLIKSIENKVAKLLNIKLEQIEPIQIVRYTKGQEYKFHYDYFTHESNQRHYTVLVYLNSLTKHDGGKTYFPIYKIKLVPKKGQAVIWSNLNLDGEKDIQTLHAGLPVETDKIKYVMTIWTRVLPY